MDRLERFMNRLSDANWTWQPFLFLRPPQNEFLTSGRVFLIAVLFSPVALLLCGALVFGHWLTPLRGLGLFGGFLAGFFVMYRLSFAYCWNRRAARLQGAVQAAGEPVTQ